MNSNFCFIIIKKNFFFCRILYFSKSKGCKTIDAFSENKPFKKNLCAKKVPVYFLKKVIFECNIKQKTFFFPQELVYIIHIKDNIVEARKLLNCKEKINISSGARAR